MPDGPFNQYCMFGDDGAVVFARLRDADWNYTNDVYGNTAAGADRRCIRRLSFRDALPGVRRTYDFAVVGEVIGTGIIGAIVSYPVMAFLMGRGGLSLMFYVPSFICGTLIGGSVAFIFLKYLNKAKMLVKMQQMLGSQVQEKPSDLRMDAAGIGFLGIIVYLAVFVVAKNIFKLTGVMAKAFPIAALILVEAIAIVYYVTQSKKEQEHPNV